MKALVLAGGLPGSLDVLVPQGRSKHTIKIMGKPIIAYPVQAVSEVIGGEVILVYSSEDVLTEARRYSKGLIIGVKQVEPGIEGAIVSAEGKLSDTDYFMLLYGDIILDSNALRQLLKTFYDEEPDAAFLTIPLEEKHASTYGVAIVDIDGFVKNVMEKPREADVRGLAAYTLGGAYILPTSIIDWVDKMGFTKALLKLVREGRVLSVHWSGLWIDIGYPTDILEASTRLLQRLNGIYISDNAVVEEGAIIKPPAYIDDRAYIDHYAVIKGPAYIGKESFIGAHAFVRDCGDVEERVRVGAYSEVKHSIIQPYTIIDSYSYIADSIVGENTSIGSRVITLNVLPPEETPPRLREYLVTPSRERRLWKLGSIIGYNVKISAGKILKPGEVIKPNTIY